MHDPNFKFRRITGISLVAAMGGLLFGYDWVVIGGAKPFYEQFFQIAQNPSMQGWAISCALVGCVVGTVLSGVLSDKYGRKKLLLASSVLFLVSAIGTGAVNGFASFVWYRILGGVGIGIASNLSPIYIAEVTPAKYRGRFVSINQLTIVAGILLAQLINWQIAEPLDGSSGSDIFNSWNGQMGWRYMFWAETIPAATFFALMWYVPDSPRWLVQKGKINRAASILTRIGGNRYSKETIAHIVSLAEHPKERTSLKKLIRGKNSSVIFMYAEEVFLAAGYSVSDMLFNVVITGSVNLVFTFAAMALVDKIGRKILMLTGAGGLTIIYTLLGAMYFYGATGWPLLLLVVSAIGCYAMTLAPVTWVVLSEIFPGKIRGAAMATATFSLWTANALLAYFFPIINTEVSASGSFWLFAIICAGGFFFIKTTLTETKGKSLEEIEQGIVRN